MVSVEVTWEHAPDTRSARERPVLALLAKGLSNPEIAVRLSVSRSTAKAHVSNIFSKLGISSRAEAAALAVQHKLIDGM